MATKTKPAATKKKIIPNIADDFGIFAKLSTSRNKYKAATGKMIETKLKKLKSEYMQSKHRLLDRLDLTVKQIGEAKRNRFNALKEQYFQAMDSMQQLLNSINESKEETYKELELLSKTFAEIKIAP